MLKQKMTKLVLSKWYLFTPLYRWVYKMVEKTGRAMTTKLKILQKRDRDSVLLTMEILKHRPIKSIFENSGAELLRAKKFLQRDRLREASMHLCNKFLNASP